MWKGGAMSEVEKKNRIRDTRGSVTWVRWLKVPNKES